MSDDDDDDGAFVGVNSSTCRGISIATIDASKVKEKDKDYYYYLGGSEAPLMS